MPTRQDYSRIVRRELKPYLDRPGNAWKGIYRLLMWYEHGVPHIIDADKLKQGPWRERAKLVEKTRQDPLGIGFVEALLFFLRLFAATAARFILKVPSANKCSPE